MKKIITIVLITVAIVACDQPKSATPAPPPEKKMEAMEVKKDSGALDLTKLDFAYKYDYSCGMPVSAGVSDTVTYKGKLYGFCSPECKADFLSKPEEYLSKK
jgi:YHS domain-containing protein